MKICTRCRAQKDLAEFPRRAASKDGYASACKDCLNAQKQIDYEAAPKIVMLRVKKNAKARAVSDPVYRQAWDQWRYAKSLGRVPSWVSFSKDMLPKLRVLLIKKPGWTVDHIIPLQGKTVSGLHVPTNLQALPSLDNSRKNNSFSPTLLSLYDS